MQPPIRKFDLRKFSLMKFWNSSLNWETLSFQLRRKILMKVCFALGHSIENQVGTGCGRGIACRRYFNCKTCFMINFTRTSKQVSPKIAFKETNLCKIIVSSVARSQNVTEAEVEHFCGRSFRGGADRNGGRAKRS
ncbi:unnamed protein product [Allacma fusca]|uniref:Uncharacterized protein n=1 Tax=Allacma fusca TaxID=39272 RepID=A0A8J2K1N5_9HEXA|nr:unnamed protein product [Allacma fusca]